MAQAKLTPEMKKFIEKNAKLSNRFLSERISDNYKTKVSHTIVGRHKKVFLETGVETPVEIVPETPIELVETSKLPVETSVETPKEKVRKIKRVTAEKMVENIILTKVRRGISNERIVELAKFVVAQIYEDCLEKGN